MPPTGRAATLRPPRLAVPFFPEVAIIFKWLTERRRTGRRGGSGSAGPRAYLVHQTLQIHDHARGGQAAARPNSTRFPRHLVAVLIGAVSLATLALVGLPTFGSSAIAARLPAAGTPEARGVAASPLTPPAATPAPDRPARIDAAPPAAAGPADPTPPDEPAPAEPPESAESAPDEPAAGAAPPPNLVLDLPAGAGSTVSVPILMYHHIGGLPANPDRLRVNLTLDEDDFAGHLDYLARDGYQTVTLNDVIGAMYGAVELPPKPIVLTFDDGYRDHYTNAFPLLQAHGFTGTFFVVTNLVGGEEHVTWDQLREMAAAGMRIEAHGVSHQDLRELSPARIYAQALEARETLESEIGEPVRFYCYPSGKYTVETPVLMAEAGYLGAVTVRHGLTSDPGARFEIPRVRINRGDDAQTLGNRIG